jgi:hypothetical protein
MSSSCSLEAPFDKGAPETLAAHLPRHEISTVRAEGWKGVKNGMLLNTTS